MSDQKKPTDTSPDESQAKELDEDQLEQVAGGAAAPTESITFVYSKIGIKYTPADPDGGGEISFKVIGEDSLARKK